MGTMTVELHVGFTGTRQGMTEHQLAELHHHLNRLHPTALHHGDCIGADQQAHLLGKDAGYRIVVHPPTDSTRRAWCEGDEQLPPLPFLERDRAIVDSCDILIAAPLGPDQPRSGTWYTIRYAQKTRRPLIVLTHWPTANGR